MIAPPVGGTKENLYVGLTFAAASLLGGVASGSGIYLIGLTVRTIPFGSVILHGLVIAAAVAAQVEMLLDRRLWVPSSGWLIPRQWAAMGRSIFTVLFGFHLGLGWRTKVNSNLFWAFVGGVALAPAYSHALIFFALFALTRAVPVVVGGIVEHLTGVALDEKQVVRLVTQVARSDAVRYATFTVALALVLALSATLNSSPVQ